MTYTYPDDQKPGGRLQCFMEANSMKHAIERAASKILDDGRVPSFSRVANVVVGTKEEDAEFVRECFEGLPADPLGMDMPIFAYSCLTIQKLGWDGFVEKLRERDPDGLFHVI